jgi:hypothetical protein
MRVQLEDLVSVAARMMPILQGVDVRGLRSAQASPHENGGCSRKGACTRRGRWAGDGLLRQQGVPGRWGERFC